MAESRRIGVDHTHYLFGIDDTHQLADRLAALLRVGDCLTLQGDLGAGKTTLVQRLVQALSCDLVAVTSPTFNLVQTYDVMLSDGQKAALWHYDLYRLEDDDDVRELGLEDALAYGIPIIEWPELVIDWLPASRIAVAIEYGEGSDNRRVTVSSDDPATLRRLKEADLC